MIRALVNGGRIMVLVFLVSNIKVLLNLIISQRL